MASVLCTLLASAPAFNLAGLRPAVPLRLVQPAMQEPAQVAAGRLLAASTLALALNGATPSLTQAAVEPQFGANFVADEAADLREAQQKFLQERAKMQQEYDTDIESNYKSEEEVTDKK